MTWLRNHLGRVVTQFQIAQLFGISYAKAATLQNAISGFSKTGIYPLNPNIFSDHDFISAATTDIDVRCTDPVTNYSEPVIVETPIENTVVNTDLTKSNTVQGTF